MKIFLITGGAGFIGTNFIRHVLTIRPDWHIVNVDSLTYSGNLSNFKDFSEDYKKRHAFVHGDIRDTALLENLFSHEKFDGVIHFAAESHVEHAAGLDG